MSIPTTTPIVRRPASRSQQGFAYLFVLLTVMLIGIVLGAVGTSWKQTMQREREEELLFRGMQIQDAIARWHKPKPGIQQHVATQLNDLKDLLQDPRSPETVRYLRKLYLDPMTNHEWGLVRDASHGIVGVVSTSSEKAIKQDNFPEQVKDFARKERYDQWQFLYTQTTNANRLNPLQPQLR